jgi:GNAT superfamily N-acetyltransferase
VSEALQHRGLGRLLMGAVASHCLAAGSAGLYLWVLRSNTPARRFYERLGARNAGDGVWIAPRGEALPRRRYVWRDVRVILHTT